MRYYLHYKNNQIVGCSQAYCESQEFICKEVSKEEFNLFMSKEKDKELNEQRKVEIQGRLNQLTQDFIQADLGAVFDDLEARKSEFKTLHNELRELQGKEKREYI